MVQGENHTHSDQWHSGKHPAPLKTPPEVPQREGKTADTAVIRVSPGQVRAPPGISRAEYSHTSHLKTGPRRDKGERDASKGTLTTTTAALIRVRQTTAFKSLFKYSS